MATYYSSRCPHCGTLLYSGRSKEPKAFGPTKQICNHCGKEFLRDNFYERINLTKEEKLSVLVLGPDMYLTTEKKLQLAIILAACLFFLIVPIYYLILGMQRYNKFKNFNFSHSMIDDNLLIQQSIERTKDNEYCKLLEKQGRIFYGVDFE